jgi:hypothetical protein
MNKLLCFAVASLLPLAACTSVPMASVSNGASGASPAGERYCAKRQLSESDGKLHCNWVTDRSQVCGARHSESIEMGRYTAPAPSGRCETGEYLVKVQPRA